MNDKKNDGTNGQNLPKTTESVEKVSNSVALSGAEKLLDGQTHTGIAILVSSDGKPSTLMIPDVTQIDKGAPVYITKPIRIKGENLWAFLKEKGVTLIPAIENLIEKTEISCEAFSYTKEGPLLMMFALKTDEGLIKTLTGDEHLGKLFDIHGASVRVLLCPEKSFPVLMKYVAELEE